MLYKAFTDINGQYTNSQGTLYTVLECNEVISPHGTPHGFVYYKNLAAALRGFGLNAK